jgi:hypothetical protein
MFIIVLLPSSGWALVLREMYTMDANSRVLYLGGIYDSNIIDYRGNGNRSECLKAMGLSGFVQLLSKFVAALPEDQNSKERKTYDNLNVALISALEIDKACENWPTNKK